MKHIAFYNSNNIKIYYGNCTATHITLRYKMEHTHYIQWDQIRLLKKAAATAA